MEFDQNSPERVAMTGFPEAYCRVAASRVFENDAYVLLSTNTREQPYLYGAVCRRDESGSWSEVSSHNGSCGCVPTDHDPDVGIYHFWGNAPEGADAVRVEFQGVTFEEPVAEGVFLFVRFRVPMSSAGDWPRVEAFRVNGTWRG
jgi:hypothetical protein